MSDQNNPQPYYPAPDPSQQFPPVNPTNTLAIVSLVAGIVAYLFLGFIGGLAAIITGHIALGQIKRTGQNGRGFALTGTILGYVNVALSVIAGIILLIVFLTAAPAAYNSTKNSYDRAQQQYQACVDAAGSDTKALTACTDDLANAL